MAYMLRAIQLEIGELRRELHADYLNEPQMRNVFVTREELGEARRERREWPLLLAAVVATMASLTNLVVLISGVH
jgi:hypothetical protein